MTIINRNPVGLAIMMSSLLMLSACGSDSSGGGPPANAIVLTQINTSNTVESATTIGQLLIGLVEDGIDTGSPLPCLSGSFTDNGSVTTTANGTLTTASGEVSATNCEVASAIFISGTINYNFTQDKSNGGETGDVTGGFSFTVSGVTATISNLNFKETGNFNSGDYSTNIFSFIVNSSVGDGFAVSLSQPLVGNDVTNPLCPTSGIILVEGGAGTRAQAILIGGNMVQIDLDTGSGFAEIALSPVFCIALFL